MSGFVKIYGSKLITSSLWDEAPEARLVFLAMLSIADARGYVDVPNERALARVLNLAPDYVGRALAVLMAPDDGSRTDTEEGRRVIRDGSGWLCVNYEKYREFRSARQEGTRLRVEKHRAAKAVTSNASNKPVSHVRTEAEAEAEAEEEGEGDPEARPLFNPKLPGAWLAGDWLRKFGVAWCGKYKAIAYGMASDGKACGALADLLATLPASERKRAQERAPGMFAEFLAGESPGEVKARHPFVFFVTAFGGLMTDKAPQSVKPIRNYAQEREDTNIAETMRQIRADAERKAKR